MIVHIAGLDAECSGHLRQRCAWCGTVLVDLDLARIAYTADTPEEERRPPTWGVGALVAVDGPVTWIVDPEPSEVDPTATKLPAECCGLLPPELTLRGPT